MNILNIEDYSGLLSPEATPMGYNAMNAVYLTNQIYIQVDQ